MKMFCDGVNLIRRVEKVIGRCLFWSFVAREIRRAKRVGYICLSYESASELVHLFILHVFFLPVNIAQLGTLHEKNQILPFRIHRFFIQVPETDKYSSSRS